MRGTNFFRRTARDELFLGELADGFQHRVSGPPRRPFGQQQRLAHQSVQQIEDGVVIRVSESCYSPSTFNVEPAREHRT
jgi:hypothetical protein